MVTVSVLTVVPAAWPRPFWDRLPSWRPVQAPGLRKSFQTLWQLGMLHTLPHPRVPPQPLTEPRPVHFSKSVSHASLIAQESREVHRPAGVVPRPSLHLAPVPAAPLVGQEAQVSVPRGRELPVGLGVGGGRDSQSWGVSGPREVSQRPQTGPWWSSVPPSIYREGGQVGSGTVS